jgi:DNA-binding CsgD family transcriptional regulator
MSEGRCVLIEGAAGVGKTALLDEIRRIAATLGMQSLVAHAGEFEREFPFTVVRQLFEPALVTTSPEDRARLLGGPAAAAETVLGTVGADYPIGESHASEVLHSLYWLTANLALERPLLLAVDDVQWTDPASASWLRYLRRRLAEQPIALVVTLRTLGTEADTGPADLRSDPAPDVVHVAALGEDSVDQLLQARLGRTPTSRFVSACHNATRGNAFLVRELATAIAEAGLTPDDDCAARIREFGPRSVARAIRSRLLSLPPSAAALVAASAVLGPGATRRQAGALASLGVDDVADAVHRLVAAGVFVAGPTLEFAHPIVRAAVHGELRTGERRRLHAAAASLIAAEGGAAEQVAPHLLMTPPDGRDAVVETLLRAARTAAAQGALQHAVACLRRALHEPPSTARRPVVLRELGAAEVRLGADEGLRHLREAQAASADARTDARCALELGSALVARGRVLEAASAFERAIDRLEPEDHELALRLEAELLAAARLDPAALPRIAVQLERHHRHPPVGDTPSERLLLAVLALDGALTGRPAAHVADLAQRALHLPDRTTGQLAHSPPLNQAAYALIVAGDYDGAARFLERALEVAQERGSVVGFANASCWASHLAYRRGAIDRAEADARSALDAAEAAEWRLGRPAALAYLIDTLVERGALAEAEGALERHGSVEDEKSVLTQGLVYCRGTLRLAQHRVPEALAEFERAGEYQCRWGAENPAVMPWRSSAALAHSALGHHDRAVELADEELERAGAFGEPRAIGIALRVTGMVRSGPERLEYLEQAVRVLEPSPARLEHARALIELGATLRRGGRRAAAREPLQYGVDIADRCTATALAGQGRTELRAAGGSPRHQVLSGLEALTPSERRLAEFAAGGLTNREISNALFVTPKTVEAHLRSIYRKLDITSRTELPARIAP